MINQARNLATKRPNLVHISRLVTLNIQLIGKVVIVPLTGPPGEPRACASISERRDRDIGVGP